MIAVGASLTIARLPLSVLVVQESVSCFPAKFQIYLGLLTNHPDQDVDPIIVKPLDGHPGLYGIQNGKHRLAASIIAGRKDVLAIIVEDTPQEGDLALSILLAATHGTSAAALSETEAS